MSNSSILSMATTSDCAQSAMNNVVTPSLVLTDAQLVSWLREQTARGLNVCLIHAHHRCKFYADDHPGSVLVEADPDKAAVTYMKTLAKQNKLMRLEVTPDILRSATHAEADWDARLLPATQDEIKAWHIARQALFGVGRGKSITARHAQQVWHDAGGRCMYRGCGVDLGLTALTTKAAPAAYLAHIVASDEDGPRGDPALSHKLSDDPLNVMLMCDQHHRLIDRIDVDGHDRAVLEAMRADHVNMARVLLNSLQYPRSKGIALLADLANIKSPFDPRDMRNAMLGCSLAPMPEIDQLLRRTQRDDRLRQDFPQSLLHEHEPGILELVRKLGATESLGDNVEVLSVFPLHLVPMLILSGRIIGEARKVVVFQRDRNRGWVWDMEAKPHAPESYFLDAPLTAQTDEVLLTLELSAEVDENALPLALLSRIRDGSLRWIRIRAKHPDPLTIQHPDDLEQFTSVARAAVSLIHDRLRAKHIHLVGLSPTSTLFRFGQLLQAGHHPEYRVYDRADRNQAFRATIVITGQHVSDAVESGDVPNKTILLR